MSCGMSWDATPGAGQVQAPQPLYTYNPYGVPGDTEATKPLPTLEALQQMCNEADRKTRELLYNWLYDAHGCRRF